MLIINPGSASTKIAVYRDEEQVLFHKITHSYDLLATCKHVIDEYDFRKKSILDTLASHHFRLESLDAVCGRGGMLRPLESGVYPINEKMLDELRTGKNGEHASNLGAILAADIAGSLNIPAFIVDPVSVDEMEPIARISGMPVIERQSNFHALNHKAIARQVAKDKNRNYQDLQMIIVHLGSGISVAVHKHGRIVDVNDSREGDGPMSPERSGGVPVGQLYRLCFSGRYTLNEIVRMNHGAGGLYAYLGTADAAEVVQRIKQGDEKAKLVYDAMIYQIAKEIGACATVLKGNVDYIVLTGGLAYEEYLVKHLSECVAFLGEILVYPGENEMLSLAQGALRVLNGNEKPKTY